MDSQSSILATKEDLTRVIGITNEKIEVTNTRIETSRAELIKWMFVFWVSQVITTFGFILLFLKK